MMQIHRNRLAMATAVAVLMAAASASAQWKGVRTTGPRLPDGKLNLDGPAPRTPDGKPDLSGVWLTRGIYIGDIAKDLKEPVPMQPWAAELYKHRRDTESKEDPTGCAWSEAFHVRPLCLTPSKSSTPPGWWSSCTKPCTRNGRSSPTAARSRRIPNPQWFGYSVGKWEGDTFVVSSTGFNDNVWLDNFGHPAGENWGKVRFRRKDFGHLDVDVTIDDPKTYTKPWTVTLPLVYQPDSELIDYMCTENNKDIPHLVGK